MVNTECPYCSFDLKSEPKRKRKCPRCKEQLYVVKDYYKVVRELLYKVNDESNLSPDRYANYDEFNIYSLRFQLLKRLWYAGMLINDKGDNPTPFPGFFSHKINFQISIKEFVQHFGAFPKENAFDTFLILVPKIIKVILNDNIGLGTVYSILADLALKTGNPKSYFYHKQAFDYKMQHELQNIKTMASEINRIDEAKGVYHCYSITCDKCRYLQGKVIDIEEAFFNSVIPIKECLDGLCSSQIRFAHKRYLDMELELAKLGK